LKHCTSYFSLKKQPDWWPADGSVAGARIDRKAAKGSTEITPKSAIKTFWRKLGFKQRYFAMVA
jgi:hypothetical protein